MQISNIFFQNQITKNINSEIVSESTVQEHNAETEIHHTEIKQERTEQSVIENALKSLGFKANEENIKMVNLLLENNFPVTKNNLQKLNRALKLSGENVPAEKAIFLLKNEINPTISNTNILNNYVNGETNITDSLKNILTKLFSNYDNKEVMTLLNNLTDNSVLESEIKDFNNATNQLEQLLSNDKVSKILDKYINSSDIPKELQKFETPNQNLQQFEPIKQLPQDNKITQSTPQPTTQSNLQPTTQPNPQPTTQSNPQPTSQSNPQPTSQFNPQPTSQSNPQPATQSNPQPTTQSNPQPTTQPITQSNPQPTTQSNPQPTTQPNPQPTTQSNPQPTTQSNPQPATQSNPQPTTQSSPQPTTQSSPQPTTQSNPQPTTQSNPQPTTQSNPQPTSQSNPQPTSQSNPQPSTQPATQPITQSTTQPTTQPNPQPTTQSNPQPAPQPTTQSNPQPTSQSNPQPISQPITQPTTTQSTTQSNPQPTTQSNPQPTSQPITQPTTTQSTSQPTTQSNPQPTTTQSTSQSNPQSTSQSNFQPTTQSNPQPAPQPTTTQSTSQSNPQPATQSNPQPTTQPTTQPITQSNPQPTTQSTPQPAPQPTTTQFTSQSNPQPTTQPAPQPTTQSTPQLAPQPITQSNPQPTAQSTTQPTPQPIIQPTTQSNPQTTPKTVFQPTPQPKPQYEQVKSLLLHHKDIFLPKLEKALNLGSLDKFREDISKYGIGEKVSIFDLSKALKEAFPNNIKLISKFNSLPEVRLAPSAQITIEKDENNKIGNRLKQNNTNKNNRKAEIKEIVNHNNLDIKNKSLRGKDLNLLDTNNKYIQSAKDVNTYKNKLTFEKIFFENKKILLPELEKAVYKKSLESFKKFVSDIGYKEKVSINEIDNTLKKALWDNKRLYNKFSNLQEVKEALKEIEKPKESIDTAALPKENNNNYTKKDILQSKDINIAEETKKVFSAKLFNTKELKEVLEGAFKNYPKLNERTHQILETKEKFLNKALKKLSVDFSKDYEEINRFSENFTKKLNTAQTEISSLPQREVTNEISKEINNIMSNLEFLSQIKDTAYLQLPIIINDNPTTAELFIFKNKSKNKNTKSSSAVISLDLAFLGHFEAYISKTDRNIICQFKTENNEIEKLISSKIKELNTMLKKYNYNLQQVTFKELDEKFSILSKEPKLTERKGKKSNFALDITT